MNIDVTPIIKKGKITHQSVLRKGNHFLSIVLMAHIDQEMYQKISHWGPFDSSKMASSWKGNIPVSQFVYQHMSHYD